MASSLPSKSSVFRLLCRILAGQDQNALKESVDAGLFPSVFDMAKLHDLLPALAVRCNEQGVRSSVLGEEEAVLLRQSLMDNTRRNMSICAQALKLTGQLNKAGIIPVFLKGTARLLTSASDCLGFRKQVDIDLLVQPGEVEAASDVFLADGYKFCRFQRNASPVPIVPGDARSAIKLGAVHHHLPSLVKNGYAATVELHRHALPRRFQHGNPLERIFNNARTVESHGVVFKVPSTEYQIIHLILGKLVHDGHLARRAFPIREACDYIELLDSVDGAINRELVMQHCGADYDTFSQLVTELMGYMPQESLCRSRDATRHIQMIQRRYNSAVLSRVLDTHARLVHLGYSIVYSPAKLPAYLRRLANRG